MTIEQFKNLADEINFHNGKEYGIKYHKYRFVIYRTIEKLSGQVTEMYYEDNFTQVTKEKFIKLLN